MKRVYFDPETMIDTAPSIQVKSSKINRRNFLGIGLLGAIGMCALIPAAQALAKDIQEVQYKLDQPDNNSTSLELRDRTLCALLAKNTLLLIETKQSLVSVTVVAQFLSSSYDALELRFTAKSTQSITLSAQIGSIINEYPLTLDAKKNQFILAQVALPGSVQS